MSELLDCPFCGGEAESDAYQSYRSLSSGKTGTRAVIYCTCCSADIGLCREDYFGDEREGLTEAVREAWNRRAPSVQNAELQARAQRAEVERAQHVVWLAECYRHAGADPDGDEDWRLAPHAVGAVKELRADYDKACEDHVALSAEASSLRQALAAVRQAGERYVAAEGAMPCPAPKDAAEHALLIELDNAEAAFRSALAAGPAQPLRGGER